MCLEERRWYVLWGLTSSPSVNVGGNDPSVTARATGSSSVAEASSSPRTHLIPCRSFQRECHTTPGEALELDKGKMSGHTLPDDHWRIFELYENHRQVWRHHLRRRGMDQAEPLPSGNRRYRAWHRLFVKRLSNRADAAWAAATASCELCSLRSRELCSLWGRGLSSA